MAPNGGGADVQKWNMIVQIDPMKMNEEELVTYYEAMGPQAGSREPKNVGQEMQQIMASLCAFAEGGEVLGVVEMKATAQS